MPPTFPPLSAPFSAETKRIFIAITIKVYPFHIYLYKCMDY
jgi:hypothetical protein